LTNRFVFPGEGHRQEQLSLSSVEEARANGSAGSGAGREEPEGVMADLVIIPGSSNARRDRGLAHAKAGTRLIKRAIDLVGSLVLIVVLSPILLATTIAIRVSSRGPVLFLQVRVGRGGRNFRMLKFRSMRQQAHDDRDEVIHLNEVSGPVFKIREDPRLTRVGRLIRKLSIDELPQLANVVAGHMSLVGPRPPLPDEYEAYSPRERRRLSVRPGLTCIWQVSGRSDVDFERWVAMDLQYIDTWTLWLDLKLMLLTIPAVLSGRGAY
jgi:lipopolysaccharide/colanic/teichoic acid biosynthesis glycosyltransferase